MQNCSTERCFTASLMSFHDPETMLLLSTVERRMLTITPDSNMIPRWLTHICTLTSTALGWGGAASILTVTWKVCRSHLSSCSHECFHTDFTPLYYQYYCMGNMIIKFCTSDPNVSMLNLVLRKQELLHLNFRAPVTDTLKVIHCCVPSNY